MARRRVSVRSRSDVLASIVAMVVAGAVVVLVGCGAAGRHGVLTTLFDGVPHPDSTVAEATPGPSSAAGPTTVSGRSVPVAPTLVLHSPYEDGECAECHLLESGGRLGGGVDLRLPREQLCTTCHEDMTADELRESYAWVHGPVAAGWCIGCHSPHRSAYEYLLLAAPERQLCLRCHDQERLAGATHHADAEASCRSCHEPHGADAMTVALAGDEETER